jgi:hypothetical protein
MRCNIHIRTESTYNGGHFVEKRLSKLWMNGLQCYVQLLVSPNKLDEVFKL